MKENTHGPLNPESKRSSEIHVRTAFYREADEINRLIRDSMKTYCSLSGVKKNHLESMRENKGDILSDMRDHIVLVAVEGATKIVGTVRLYLKSSDSFHESSLFHTDDFFYAQQVGYIARFAVDQSDRGRGVGSLLISEVEHMARSHKIRYLLLHTSLWNEPVSTFYHNRDYLIDSVDLSRGYPRALFYKRLRPLRGDWMC